MTIRAIVLCAVSSEAQAKDDKISMEQQEQDGLAKCEREGWDAIDIIRIPGYSRSFYTLRELVEQALTDGEHGPARLQEHIQKADFDVLVVRSTNRFNREQSLNAEIIGRVVKQCGARIFSFTDGMIDSGNYRSIAAITGYRDSHEVDELVRRRANGIVSLSSRGLPSSSKVPMSHRLIRSPETGKAERLELREEFAPLWNDLATLLLEGVAYDRLPEVLFSRWGHSAAGGKPYTENKFYKLLLNPVFWGHNVIRWKSKANYWSLGTWALDASEPPPPGVDMFYDTHPPAYTGELAERVKAELRRRREVFNGTARKYGTNKFAGLVLCLECKWRYIYNRTKNIYGTTYAYLRCNKSVRDLPGRARCTQTKHIHEADVQIWMNARLIEWLESGIVSLSSQSSSGEAEQMIQSLKDSEGKLQRRLEAFMDELSDADQDLRDTYRKKIRTTKDELLRCREQLSALEYDIERQRQLNSGQQRTLHAIRSIGLSAFWQQDGLTINQQLKALMGNSRMLAIDGEIISFGDVNTFGI